MEKIYILLYTNLETGYRKVVNVYADRELAEEALEFWADWNDEEASYELQEKVLA